jgi:hypothetical protein
MRLKANEYSTPCIPLQSPLSTVFILIWPILSLFFGSQMARPWVSWGLGACRRYRSSLFVRLLE